MKTLEQQIKESDAAFVEAFNRGDIDSLVTLHADNAMLLSPDTPMTVGGSEAVVAGYRELLDAGWTNMSLHSIKIDSDASLAYHVGKVSADVPIQGGAKKRVEGKYVDVYKLHDDGCWKVHLTIFNMDEPLPE